MSTPPLTRQKSTDTLNSSKQKAEKNSPGKNGQQTAETLKH